MGVRHSKVQYGLARDQVGKYLTDNKVTYVVHSPRMFGDSEITFSYKEMGLIRHKSIVKGLTGDWMAEVDGGVFLQEAILEVLVRRMIVGLVEA